MKRISSSFAVALIVSLAFCYQTASADDVKRVKLGTMAPAGSPWMESLELMSKKLQDATGGAFKWQIFPGGQLGDEIQMVESTQFGSVECAGISTGAIANLMPSMQVFEIPFYWESREEAYYVIDNHFRDYFSKALKKIGLVQLGWSENGWRHFYSMEGNVIRKPEDLQGLKMRSQESPVHIAFWKSLGVNPVPLPTTEIYQALERDIIDGGDNTLVLIMATGWAEVIKNVTMSGHIYQPAVLVCNQDWWETVADSHKEAFYKAMRTAETDMRDRLLKAEEELVGVFEQMDKNVIRLSEAERNAFKTRSAGVANDPQIRKMIGEDVLKIAEQGKAEFRKKQK